MSLRKIQSKAQWNVLPYDKKCKKLISTVGYIGPVFGFHNNCCWTFGSRWNYHGKEIAWGDPTKLPKILQTIPR